MKTIYDYFTDGEKRIVQFPQGHVWEMRKKDDDSDPDEINVFAYKANYCNGPRCVNCGMGFCVHCENYEIPYPCPEVQKDESR